MFDTIKNTVLYPLAGRIGSITTGWLVGQHPWFGGEYADHIGLGLTALLVLGIELMARQAWFRVR